MNIKHLSITLISFITAILMLGEMKLSAQTYSVGTNLVDYANLGTLNVTANLSVARHSTLGSTARLNLWNYGEGITQFYNRVTSVSVNYRYWPWYVYSGWWLMANLEVEVHSLANFLYVDGRKDAVKYGPGLGFGYSLMLNKNVNLDLGVLFWGGLQHYKEYCGPGCGRLLSDIDKWRKPSFFIEPNNVFVSIYYIF